MFLGQRLLLASPRTRPQARLRCYHSRSARSRPRSRAVAGRRYLSPLAREACLGSGRPWGPRALRRRSTLASVRRAREARRVGVRWLPASDEDEDGGGHGDAAMNYDGGDGGLQDPGDSDRDLGEDEADPVIAWNSRAADESIRRLSEADLEGFCQDMDGCIDGTRDKQPTTRRRFASVGEAMPLARQLHMRLPRACVQQRERNRRRLRLRLEALPVGSRADLVRRSVKIPLQPSVVCLCLVFFISIFIFIFIIAPPQPFFFPRDPPLRAVSRPAGALTCPCRSPRSPSNSSSVSFPFANPRDTFIGTPSGIRVSCKPANGGTG